LEHLSELSSQVFNHDIGLAREMNVTSSRVSQSDYHWYAVFTMSQNEKSVAQHLLRQAIQVFLPTWEKICVWKNRQKVKVTLPLFPNYIFVRILYKEKVQVLRTPGVLQIVGNHSGPLTISDSEIALLQHGLNGRKMEPYPDLVEGELVTISSGTMRGLTGTLVRRKNETRFVLSVDLINQKASIEIDASLLKPIR